MSRIYTLAELKNALNPIFEQYGVKKAVLFGSYAKGIATPRSDIDLYVDSGLRGLAFFGLLDSVATALDVPVDLVDASQVDRGSPIETEIMKSGVQIYGKNCDDSMASNIRTA
ncbi:MAG: nucleotidyltransferase domain-containing protein [Clostridia bacterium]|nr:nucleotidyltransferase domain-containing protein [Clostridia bacterium]